MMVLPPHNGGIIFLSVSIDVEVKIPEMAKPNRLKELSAEHGDLEALIVPIVNEAGQGEAARRLKISTATISTFLKKQGYVQVVRYVKKESQAS